MSILTTTIPYPKTKWGTLFLSFIFSIVLPIVFVALLATPDYLAGAKIYCPSIDYSSQCTYSEHITNFIGLYFILLTPISLGLNIIIPTVIFWIFFDYFRRRSQNNVLASFQPTAKSRS